MVERGGGSRPSAARFFSAIRILLYDPCSQLFYFSREYCIFLMVVNENAQKVELIFTFSLSKLGFFFALKYAVIYLNIQIVCFPSLFNYSI